MVETEKHLLSRMVQIVVSMLYLIGFDRELANSGPIFMIAGPITLIIYTTKPLHIQIRVLRVALNKALPRRHLIAHQHVEGLVGLHRLLNIHL